MTTWPDVALALGLLTAIVVLHVVAKGDPDARATVIILVAAVSPWLASARQGAKQSKQDAQASKDD